MPQTKIAEILLNCKPKKSHTYIYKRAEQFDGMKLSKIYNVFNAKLIPVFCIWYWNDRLLLICTEFPHSSNISIIALDEKKKTMKNQNKIKTEGPGTLPFQKAFTCLLPNVFSVLHFPFSTSFPYDFYILLSIHLYILYLYLYVPVCVSLALLFSLSFFFIDFVTKLNPIYRAACSIPMN